MNITPETKRIQEIFAIEGTHEYIIPIYQRQYSWGEKQIETLIDDISSEKQGYYIGNFLVTSNSKNSSEIVDGQQRLTTIAILFLAIYEYLSDIRDQITDQNLQDKIASIKFDIKRKLLINGGEKLRYRLLGSDHVIFENLTKRLRGEEVGRWGHRKFGKRYNATLNILKEYFKSFNDLNNFYEKLNSVEILKISVNNLSDAFSVFSALNSKGVPLTLVDLLKNEYLKKATSEGVDEESALNNWDELINILSGNQEEVDVNTSLVTQFLLNNYDAFETESLSSITKSSALDRYNKILNDKGSKYIKTLIKKAEWFMYLRGVNKSGIILEDKITSIIKELNYLDVSQSYPLLLLLFSEKNELSLNDANLYNAMQEIKKFYIIRNITLRPKASNVRSMYIKINRNITKNELKSKAIVESIQNELGNASDSREEFEKMLIQEGIYDKNSSTSRLLLIDLERNYGKYFNKANPDTLEEYTSQKKGMLRWTIEHIFPQGKNLPSYWKNGKSDSEINEFQEEYVHKLGNLTLTPYNSELGQLSFKEKRDKQDGGVDVGLKLPLFLNKSIFTDIETKYSKLNWERSDIQRRSKILAEKICEMYFD